MEFDLDQAKELVHAALSGRAAVVERSLKQRPELQAFDEKLRHWLNRFFMR